MDLPEPKLISPLLDGFVIGEPMSDHHGVCCCPALREDTGERYILKVISIPASQVQLDALLLTGAFSAPEQALSYFEDLAQGVLSEAETLAKLTKLEGFLPYTGCQLVQMDSGTGYQVYLLSPYKRSLRKHMQVDPLTHLGAINLSLDLCSALVSSRRAGYLYVDLKPSNIFLTQTQGWRIGDLGFMPLSSLKYASLPEKYRSEYTAPEITDAMSELNDTLDVYALGLVLYQVYNNGQFPFEDGAQATELPPPLYADYELAEIILKACNPVPSKRWADPAQMGQALVAYMQRNCINDTPIVPPPVETPQEVQAAEEEFLDEEENAAELAETLQTLIEEYPVQEEASETDNTSVEDEELDFIIDSTGDETIPNSENTEDLPDTFVSQEVEEMLAQADELISHELPEPAVAPAPIEIPFPAPIVLPNTENASPNVASEIQENAPLDISKDNIPADAPDDNVSPEVSTSEESIADDDAAPIQDENKDDAPATSESESPVKQEDSENPPTSENTEEGASDSKTPIAQNSLDPVEYDNVDENTDYYQSLERNHDEHIKKTKMRMWIVIITVVLLLAAAGYGLSYYYQNVYQQKIDSLSIDGDADSIRVVIGSNIEDSLLSVICTDTYGNARVSSVTNGVAEFTNLSPNTQYRILIEISGVRRLIGNASASYTTDIQTEVINFNARGGSEDGSVILSFTTNGPEPETWTVSYAGAGEAPQAISFTGHSVNITNLTIGNEYLFKLEANGEQLAGTYELSYVAQRILLAQELQLTECADGIMGIEWTLPEWSSPTKWNIRCYSDAGFDETTSTEETTVHFRIPSHDAKYTIEVTAEGMSSSCNLTVTPNPITITDIAPEVSTDGTLNLIWEFIGNAPTDGWNVEYSIDNSAAISLTCDTNQAVIPYSPGSHYDIDISPVSDVSYVGERFSYDAPQPSMFEQYGVTADDLSFYMCLTPDRENWDRFDVPAEFYRTEYTVDENASFLVEIWKEYEESEDEIHISYIIRDGDGMQVSHNSVTMVWKDMWDNRFCELDIPQMPAIIGDYTIEIYFNEYLVTTRNFKIK